MAGFAALLLAASSDLLLGLIAVGGFAGAVLVFAALSFVAVKLLRRSVNQATAPRWLVLATRQISARPVYTVVQVSALAVGLLALMLLVLLRTDLISSWRRATPPDAPNRFVINIDAGAGRCVQEGHARCWRATLRLVPDDPRPPGGHQQQDGDARRFHRRPRQAPARPRIQSLQHGRAAASQPAGGGHLDGGREGAISVEQGIAKELDLKMGDTLRFDIAGVHDRREDHFAAQGGLGLDAGQLLRDLSGEPHARCTDDLPHGLQGARDTRL